MRLFSRRLKLLIGAAAFAGAYASCSSLPAQDDGSAHGGARSRSSPAAAEVTRRPAPHRIVTIHWQRVPLREALGRLHGVFNETVFADRRIDPGLRVSLDIQAGSAEEVVAAIATQHRFGVGRIGSLVYLGPSGAAERLASIAAARAQEVARLPAGLRASLARKKPVTWPRLTEPRRLVTSLVEQHGWRIENAEKIPYDLWAAGELPDLTFTEQLTVLLTGFDLTFDVQPNERSIRVVALKGAATPPGMAQARNRSGTRSKTISSKPGARQVYTLRVQEQPVRAVLQALSQRLHWAIQIDEESIRAAGKSLDRRVSFSVENADQEHLLDALLKPAGLDYRLEEDRVRIIARRYSD